ncbi:hypothetical protein A9Q81_19855 [Gammaproteobacteria bacterium 42_54_T18]|nr:hypothetical protein A9Q81_19855 [Gammaproteobacteria bacterium 42_54_T18]
MRWLIGQAESAKNVLWGGSLLSGLAGSVAAWALAETNRVDVNDSAIPAINVRNVRGAERLWDIVFVIAILVVTMLSCPFMGDDVQPFHQ